MTRARNLSIDFGAVDPRNTYYRLLQVDELADREIIRLAYRYLARRHHPDVAPGPRSESRMRALNQAYAVLRDAEARASYDAALAKRRQGHWTEAQAALAMDRYGDAGEPPGPPSGSVVDFGRYRGWTLGQIRRRDPDFLEWLAKVPVGRRYRDEISRLLQRSA